MRPHRLVARALTSSVLHHASKTIAPPTLIGSEPAGIAVYSTANPAAVTSPAKENRPKVYPLNGFNYLTASPSNLPAKSEQAQYGTNACGQYGPSRQDSLCQNAVLNSADDFCLWGPPYSDGKNGSIAATERFEVAWCTKAGRGTRLIPDNTLTSVHFIQTPLYVQVTGTGNFANIGIPANDQGGELDPHGDDETGNPQGGLVFSNSFLNTPGVLTQSHQWTMFIGGSNFCFRVCSDGPQAAATCNHIYDTLGCDWNMPSAPLVPGTFESCKGDAASPPMGVYVDNGVTSTFTNGAPSTPAAHPAPSSSMCSTQSSIPTNGATVNPVYAALAEAAGGQQPTMTSSISSFLPTSLPSSSASTGVIAVVTAMIPPASTIPLLPPLSASTVSAKSTGTRIPISRRSAWLLFLLSLWTLVA